MCCVKFDTFKQVGKREENFILIPFKILFIYFFRSGYIICKCNNNMSLEVEVTIINSICIP